MTPGIEGRRETPDGLIWEVDEEKETIEGLDENGRPDPAYAAALGLLRAPLGRRALAVVCDVAIWVVVQLPLWIGAVPLLLKLADGSISPYGFMNHPGFVLAVVMAAVTTFLTLVLSVLQLVLHGRSGRTLGKTIVGIRTVNVRTLERPGIGWVLLRYLLVCASNIIPLLGPVILLLSPTFDSERRGRGLHDKATHVWLIDVRQGLNPYDQKRLRVARKLVKAEPARERSVLPSLATPTDPSQQPAYRPGNRVSAGVIGIARPHTPDARPEIGLPQTAPPSLPAPAELGKPVLGGYRQSDDERPVDPAQGVPPVGAAQPSFEAAPVAPSQHTPPQPAVLQPAPLQPAPAWHFGLRLDTGASVAVTEPLLFGRNPDPAVFPTARPVPLDDESKSLSKTHLLVRPVDGGLEITDCGSTNGSGLMRAGIEYVIEAGVPVVSVDGDTIRLGDRSAVVVRA
ncbi:RDD family protein [Microbacterium sp. AK031]|uniref:RDD family protein n=1 Tax=Microbacterium sp. AK031 TaxID=2723076 RepID=UPI002168C622|nr:RDD family protein [Microbacterium sp. AK031]MCS3843480.1 putative RDD family membrane protein YckC [Microbacterium sp. AK031]